jgi:hypothetical protein
MQSIPPVLLSALPTVVFPLQHFNSWYHKKLCSENSTPSRDLLRPFAPKEKAENGRGGDHPQNINTMTTQ